MIWSSLFAISIAQGLFLISLLLSKGSKNPTASRLIIAMIILMVMTSIGYLVIRTDLGKIAPQLFGVPFGVVFLFGPLFYFYSQSVIDPTFRWKKKYWLHFIPYVLQTVMNLPFLLAGRSVWVGFVETFLTGNLTISNYQIAIFIFQDLHLLIYLFFIFRWLQKAKRNSEEIQFLIPASARIKWISSLMLWFTFFFATVVGLFTFVLVKGKYDPITNYIYTLITSGIIYFIAYNLLLKSDLVSPDFAKKYKSYMPFNGEDGEALIARIKTLMNESKIYTDPDLKLTSLAKEIGLPSHQLSKFINEKFGKGFNDFVNEYRVNEFIRCVNDPKYQSFSIYGIALEVGFNSKSTFNTSFKKITKKNPSDYKTPV